MEINVLKDFSANPGLRYCKISEKSGEEFYHQILNAAFKDAYENSDKLFVLLDGTEGYAPSFLDEAFGNLVYDFTLRIVKKSVEIISNDEPMWIAKINEMYEKWENRRINKDSIIVTKNHPAWYRIIDNKMEKQQWEHV